jgi:hypothetical protein
MIAIIYHFFANDIYMIVYHFLDRDIDMIYQILFDIADLWYSLVVAKLR